MRLVIELGRDEEGHPTGWVAKSDGLERVPFTGTLELVSVLVDRFTPKHEAGADVPQAGLAEPGTPARASAQCQGGD